MCLNLPEGVFKNKIDLPLILTLYEMDAETVLGSKSDLCDTDHVTHGAPYTKCASRHGRESLLDFYLFLLSEQHGKTALHLAAENGHEQVADMLLYQKAFVNAKSKHGLTPLHLAAANGNVALVKLLVGKHAATIDALTLVSVPSLFLRNCT